MWEILFSTGIHIYLHFALCAHSEYLSDEAPTQLSTHSTLRNFTYYPVATDTDFTSLLMEVLELTLVETHFSETITISRLTNIPSIS